MMFVLNCPLSSSSFSPLWLTTMSSSWRLRSLDASWLKTACVYHDDQWTLYIQRSYRFAPLKKMQPAWFFHPMSWHCYRWYVGEPLCTHQFHFHTVAIGGPSRWWIQKRKFFIDIIHLNYFLWLKVRNRSIIHPLVPLLIISKISSFHDNRFKYFSKTFCHNSKNADVEPPYQSESQVITKGKHIQIFYW